MNRLQEALLVVERASPVVLSYKSVYFLGASCAAERYLQKLLVRLPALFVIPLFYDSRRTGKAMSSALPLNVDRGGSVLAALWVPFPFTVFLLTARFSVRVSRRMTGMDDWFMLAAWVILA